MDRDVGDKAAAARSPCIGADRSRAMGKVLARGGPWLEEIQVTLPALDAAAIQSNPSSESRSSEGGKRKGRYRYLRTKNLDVGRPHRWRKVGRRGGSRRAKTVGGAGGQRRWAADPRRIRSAGGGGVLVIRDGGGGGCRRRGGVSPDRRRRLRLRLVRMVADARAGWRWPESEEGRRRFRRERESGDEERREEGCEQLRVGFFSGETGGESRRKKTYEKKMDEKKPDESGGTKINPERGLPTETLGVEIYIYSTPR